MSLCRRAPVSRPRQSLAPLLLAAAMLLCTATANVRAQDTPAPAPSPSPQARDAVKASESDAESQANRIEGREAARATGSITGRVVDESGEPFVGVTVFLGGRGTSGFGQGATTATTGEDGRFRFDHLTPSAYTLNASVPGYVALYNPLFDRTARRFYYLGDHAQIILTKGGVITGTVRDTNGDPLVGVRVRAVYVRDPEGRVFTSAGVGGEFETDDRGVYRIYGLQSGSYVVAAGGGRRFSTPFPSSFDEDAPTFHPSSTRDGAAEVAVQAGQEASAIDIRYRGKRGRSVSGQIVNLEEEGGGTNLILAHASTGMIEAMTFTQGRTDNFSFTFDGVADGDYDLIARRTARDGEQLASQPLRVRVRGADVTGLKLTLSLLASLKGRVQYEAPAKAAAAVAPATAAAAASAATVAAEQTTCAATNAATPLPQEIVLSLRRDLAPANDNQPRPYALSRPETTPDAQGEFLFRGLDEGRYFFEARPPAEAWYLRFVTLPSATTPRAAQDQRAATPTGRATATPRAATVTSAPSAPASSSVPPAYSVTLQRGQRLSGLLFTFAHGAASLRGQLTNLTTNGEAARLEHPTLWRVFLLPAEREQADNLLRFYEAPVTGEQTFAFANLAPGRYLILARPADTSKPDAPLRPAAQDAAERAQLRREAEAANLLLDLQPCQRLEGFTLKSSR